ncbi:MAG: alpha/beta hydrolase [Myxococcota bacterium]|nr:alpha/beta hydrolase [Myxococcota bacterium]
MRRVLLGGIIGLALLIAAPPLYYTLFGDSPPPLPAPDTHVDLPDGRRIHLLDEGVGEPLLLVHGLPGVSWDWGDTRPALVERGFRVLSMDRAGYGHSDPRKDAGAYTYESNGQDVVDLLAAMGLESAVVVGWSFGGGTTIHAARLSPERVRGAVLVASSGPLPEGLELPGPPPVFQLLFSPPVLRWIGAVPPLSEGLRRSTTLQAFSEQPVPDWWHTQLAASMAQDKTRQAWVAEGENASPPWSDLDPGGLEPPVLVIHGTEDRFVPLAIGEGLAERAPKARLVVVEAGSHMIPVTHAGRVADAIAEFARGL